MNYFGEFKSIENIQYRVEVITHKGDTWKEYPMDGEMPVNVVYSPNERLFDALRTSTCTVSFLTEDYPLDIYADKVDSSEVLVYRDGQLEWQGFVQPKIYNQGYSDPVERLDIVASDYLASLQYYKYEIPEGQARRVVSFKSILERICNLFPRMEGFMVAPIGTSEGRTIHMDDLFISEENFFSTEGEAWDLQQVLGEMCKFLGMQAVAFNRRLFIMDAWNSSADPSAPESMDEYLKSNGYYSNTRVQVSRFKSIESADYRMTGADMSLDDVFNKVKVRNQMYNKENILPGLNDNDRLRNLNGPWEAIQKRECTTQNTHTGWISVGTGYYRFFEHSDWKQHIYSPSDSKYTKPVEISLTDKQRGDANNLRNYIMPSILDFGFDSIKAERLAKIDLKRYILLAQHNNPVAWLEGEGENSQMKEGNTYVPLIDTTVSSPCVWGDDAWLIINCQAASTFFFNQPFITDDDSVRKDISWGGLPIFTYYDHLMQFANPVLSLVFKMRINGKWWNGKDWQSQECTFEVKQDPRDFDNYFATFTGTENRTPGELFIGELGYRVKLPSSMEEGSTIYFGICQPKPSLYGVVVPEKPDYGPGGNAYTWISDIKMSIRKEGQQLWGDDDMVTENVIDSGRIEEDETIELKFSSDNPQTFSYSTVGISESGNRNLIKPLKNIQKRRQGANQKPEENIVEAYVGQYSTPSIMENVTLDLGKYKLFDIITDTYWNRPFQVVGLDRDYMYERQTLNLLEKK